MSTEMKILDVTILGREFRISCPEEEQQSLLQAVAYLDQKMREIRDGGKVVGFERIAVMSALNITHELLKFRIAGGFDMGDFKRRITSIVTVVDQAMAEQDELF